MSRKDDPRKSGSSDSGSGSESSEELPANKFVNDGSFMELFRKRMEEQKQSSQSGANPDPRNGGSNIQKEVFGTVANSKPIPYQGIIGKRKALVKTAELREKRKRRKEELEERKLLELGGNHSQAWKAYMAEVKAYEARSCTDSDGHKRPLVK